MEMIKNAKMMKFKKQQTDDLKPMGIRSSYYPEGYLPPIKRTFSDGTTEYIIPIESQKKMYESVKNLHNTGKSELIC